MKPLFFSFLFALFACPLASAADPARPLRVAVILPLSGDAAGIGAAIKNGVILAEESLPPEARTRIDVSFADDRLDPKQTLSEYLKLASSGEPPDVVINASSATCGALAPVTEKRGVPLIAIASDPAIVAGRKHTALLWVTPEAETEALFPELKRRGYKRLARISGQHPGPLSVNRIFDADPRAADFKLALDEEYALDVKEFRPFITKLRSLPEVDGIIVALMPGQISAFAKQARQAGVKAPFVGWELFEDESEVAASEGALVGAWFVNADDPSGNFMDRYRARFPGAPSLGAANGHDALMLISHALSNPSLTLDERLRTLKDFEGALGVYSATGKGTFTLPAAIKEVTASGFKRVSEAKVP